MGLVGISLNAVTRGGDHTGAALSYDDIAAYYSLVVTPSGFTLPQDRNVGYQIRVALDVSHDMNTWAAIGEAAAIVAGNGGYPGSFSNSNIAFPARYARARITDWPEIVADGTITATIAAVLPVAAGKIGGGDVPWRCVTPATHWPPPVFIGSTTSGARRRAGSAGLAGPG